MERGFKKKLSEHKNSIVLVADEMNLNQETKIKNIWYFKDKEPIVQAKRKGESQSFLWSVKHENRTRDGDKG